MIKHLTTQTIVDCIMHDKYNTYVGTEQDHKCMKSEALEHLCLKKKSNSIYFINLLRRCSGLKWQSGLETGGLG